ILSVQLSNSGLKVSKIILGCMSYGSPEWQSWILEEEESIKHIKAVCLSSLPLLNMTPYLNLKVYSNGLSKVILGKAIKQHNLPQDEIIVMTKVCPTSHFHLSVCHTHVHSGYIFNSVKKSLECLQLDYVNVL
ncbi:NADP-dependent oxidoreductase domain-containing protein, partial [Crucibulum laeve]